LGQPLFAAESQWSRARKAALDSLRPYHAEAAALSAAWNEKRSFTGFSYQEGKLEFFNYSQSGKREISSEKVDV
jgi:hypothetical protein